MTITKDQINATLTRLAEQFPQTFVLEKHLPHRPLKVGIAADIQAALPDLDRRALFVALKVYTHRIVYLQAVVVGAERVDLDGNPAGQVTRLGGRACRGRAGRDHGATSGPANRGRSTVLNPRPCRYSRRLRCRRRPLPRQGGG